MFPVVSDGHLEGCVETRALSQIPRGEWDRHTVAEVMRHDLTALTISPDADALDALSKMQRNGVTCLLVTARDRLVGMIGLSDLLRFLDLKLDLEGADDSGSGQRVEGEARDIQVERPRGSGRSVCGGRS